jgi:hypothetical protein
VESEDRWLGWSGRGMWKAGTSKVVARPVLVKDQWIGPASKYSTYRSHVGDMGPISLITCRQQRVALPTLLQWLAQERNQVRTHGLVNRRAVDYVGSPFSRE